MIEAGRRERRSRSADRVAAVRELLARAACVRERGMFIRRELGRAQALAMYHLRGTELPFWLRHRTPDVFALDQAFVQRHFELPEPAHALLSAAPAPEVVDLGANIGLFGLSVLARYPSAHITAFEPDADTASILSRTAGSGPRASWTVVRACAATVAGEVAFEGGRFGLSRTAPDGAGTGTVPAVDVFPYLQAADLIKVDIEGSEWPILLDDRFPDVRAPVVHIEYHPYLCPESDPRALATRVLTDAGYSVRQLVTHSLREGIIVGCRPS